MSPLATRLLQQWGTERPIKLTELLLSRQGELTEEEKLSFYFEALLLLICHVLVASAKSLCACLIRLFVWNWKVDVVLGISDYIHSELCPFAWLKNKADSSLSLKKLQFI